MIHRKIPHPMSCPPQPPPTTKRGSRLWLWFVAAFVLQLSAWTAWFIIAGQHQVAEVPLVSAEPVKR
jgi:hypothetical protein